MLCPTNKAIEEAKVDFYEQVPAVIEQDCHGRLQCGREELMGRHGKRTKMKDNREVKFDVYGKRQTANGKLLPSVFSSLYSRIKIFVFSVNSKRHFSIFV